MPDFDLLVLGDANPDLIVRGDVTPEFGQAEKLVDQADLVIGGSGAIAACGAARLGLRVAFAGVVGDDVFGRFMLDALAERDVDTTGVVVDRAGRPAFRSCCRRARTGPPSARWERSPTSGRGSSITRSFAPPATYTCRPISFRPAWRPAFLRCSGRPTRSGPALRSTPTGILRMIGTAACCRSCHRPIASSPTRWRPGPSPAWTISTSRRSPWPSGARSWR